MFRGSIPTIVSTLVTEHVREWSASEVWVGCSGAFTVERLLQAHSDKIKTVRSSDVLLFSAAVGKYCAGEPMDLALSELGQEEVPWLQQYLTTPESSLAALLIMSKMAITVGKKEGSSPYFAKLAGAYVDQFPRMHTKTVEEIKKSTLKLASYDSEDAMTWIDKAPPDAAVMAYPPFQAAGAAQYFARDFASMEKVFAWEPPEYASLEGPVLHRLYEKIADRREWTFATNKPIPGFEEFLRSKAQMTNRAPQIHIYGSHGPRRRVGPRQRVDPIMVPHLSAEDELGDHMTLAPLSSAQFSSVRSHYMNAGIKPSSPALPIAVLVDGTFVGAFAHDFQISFSQWERFLPPPYTYLLSDFPVSGTAYPRLAKLIVMAAVSTEAQALCRRFGKKPYRSMTTTAFSKNPVSMKYRGVLDLLKRDENHVEKTSYADNIPEGDSYYHRPWNLQYGGLLGVASCDEQLATWKKKYGKKGGRSESDG